MGGGRSCSQSRERRLLWGSSVSSSPMSLHGSAAGSRRLPCLACVHRTAGLTPALHGCGGSPQHPRLFFLLFGVKSCCSTEASAAGDINDSDAWERRPGGTASRRTPQSTSDQEGAAMSVV